MDARRLLANECRSSLIDELLLDSPLDFNTALPWRLLPSFAAYQKVSMSDVVHFEKVLALQEQEAPAGFFANEIPDTLSYAGIEQVLQPFAAEGVEIYRKATLR